MNEILLPHPPSANRYWRIANNRLYPSSEAKKFKTDAAWAARAAGWNKPVEGAVRVSVAFHPRKNKTGLASRVRLDLDNSLKVAIDALNGVVWLDDFQIVEIRAVVAEPKDGGGLSVKVWHG